ncbi:MAG: DUF4157 domain-containing protein [Chitinophagaceae bacterium]|nr:DUF4157 domain-containing protein [Chitinophagaceae bacterium]
MQGKFETVQRVEEEEPLQGKFEAIQRVEEEEPLQGKFETIQRVEEEEPLQGKFEAIQRVEEEEPLQGKFETVQRVEEEEEPLQGKFETIQKMGGEEEEVQMKRKTTGTVAQLENGNTPPPTPNKTGMPDKLKSGIENLSGISIDDVKVHYNSSKPAQLNAHAYAQGTDIHVAPGQEKHLPHEAWHTVQQKQGRVKPTLQMKQGIPVNDDTGLEKEADDMGAKAMQMKAKDGITFTRRVTAPSYVAPVQGGFWDKMKGFFSRGGSAIKSGATAAGSAIKSGASAAGSALASGAKATGAFASSAVNGQADSTDSVNSITGTGLPLASAIGSGIGAADTIKNQKLDLGPSYGGSSLGILGGTVTGGLGAKELVKGIQTGDAKRGFGGALDVASGGLSIAGGALSMAGSSAVPGLGLAAASLDTARNIGTAVYTDKQKKKLEAQHARLAESGGNVSAETLSADGGKGYKDANMIKQYQMLQIAKRAAVVREKQRNRAIVNSVASGIETAGHATMVGTGATGIGAAVGAGLVAGGKGIKAGAGLFRWIKQKAIDAGLVGKGKLDPRTSAGKASDAMSFIAHAKDNYQNPEVQQSLELMGANKEQMALFKEGKLSVDEMYKLYKAR